jgi:hypothetical protein
MWHTDETRAIEAWARQALSRVTLDRNQRGEIAQTVIIVAILAAAAIAIATIIATKFRDKASSIPTG